VQQQRGDRHDAEDEQQREPRRDGGQPWSRISTAMAGVSRTPPTDRPVDATDSATERRRTNQRVTRVVPGTRLDAANPAPKTACAT
jgi:hypothetical protein